MLRVSGATTQLDLQLTTHPSPNFGVDPSFRLYMQIYVKFEQQMARKCGLGYMTTANNSTASCPPCLNRHGLRATV